MVFRKIFNYNILSPLVAISIFLSPAIIPLTVNHFSPDRKTKKGIEGVVVSEKFKEGETVKGEGIFHSGRVVKDFRYDRYWVNVNSEGKTFLCDVEGISAKGLDMAYNAGDKIVVDPFETCRGVSGLRGYIGDVKVNVKKLGRSQKSR